MTRYAVTGGAGFIGSNIVGNLVGRGHHVTVIDDLSSGHMVNLNPYHEVDFVNASILDESALMPAFEGVDTVFHLAASVGNKRSIDNPALDSKINVLGTINVLEACRAAGVRKIVVSSSAGIFGELHELPISEDHPVEPDSPYGASKLAAEKLCLAYAKLYDLEAIALRYFNVYGPNQRFDAYGNVIPIFVFKMLNGEPITIFGDGDQTRDFISVTDVVQANIKASEAVGVSGAFNIASGSRITINDLVAHLSDLVPGQPSVSHGPERPGDVRDSLADVSA
ncbi:MAG: NAD-dependent epimerase/dehydratase family protein, partial [Chloroflexi bacterium]|nr:NAD-dependent epimerase/dehydratase family protein [Chloroflexota bacterium]